VLVRSLSRVSTLEHVSTVAPPSPLRTGRRVWIGALLDLVFPPFCPVCQRRLGEGRRDPLCGVCWEGLDRIAPPYCRVCGLPFARVAGSGGPLPPNVGLCGRCRRRLPPFTYARAAVRYGEVARETVHALKFRGCRALAAPLGDLIAGMATTTGLPFGPPDLLAPVPLHPRRERERGFNQSLLLARRVGQAWGVPVCADALERTLATRPQTELTAEARRANVRAAFALRRPERVAGRHVALIDDVVTTGSTAAACARCLESGGASRVGVLTVARAI
jgi:ComF family protein